MKSVEEAARLYRYRDIGGTPLSAKLNQYSDGIYDFKCKAALGEIKRAFLLFEENRQDISVESPNLQNLAVVVHPNTPFAWCGGYQWLLGKRLVKKAKVIFPLPSKDNRLRPMGSTIISFDRAIDRITYVRMSHWNAAPLIASICDSEVIENVISCDVSSRNITNFVDRIIVIFEMKSSKHNKSYRFPVLSCLLRFGPVKYLAFHSNATKVFQLFVSVYLILTNHIHDILGYRFCSILLPKHPCESISYWLDEK